MPASESPTCAEPMSICPAWRTCTGLVAAIEQGGRRTPVTGRVVQVGHVGRERDGGTTIPKPMAGHHNAGEIGSSVGPALSGREPAAAAAEGAAAAAAAAAHLLARPVRPPGASTSCRPKSGRAVAGSASAVAAAPANAPRVSCLAVEHNRHDAVQPSGGQWTTPQRHRYCRVCRAVDHRGGRGLWCALPSSGRTESSDAASASASAARDATAAAASGVARSQS
jgi:hypothetical protein